MPWLCGVANRLWRAAAWADDRRFLAALSDPARTQRNILKRYIETNRDTAFGRDHHFSKIDSIERFRGRVPLSTWDDYAPFVDRIMAGEQNVLARDRARRLVPSSGSTRAAKLIPYTSSLRREFNAAISPWIVDLYCRKPDLMNGPAYWSISPAASDDASSASAVPVGFGEDSEYLLPILRPLVDSTLAVPPRVRHLREINRFRDETNLHLLAARELRTDANYRVVVTTAGGLYRYQLHDRVKVTGSLGATPSLEFLGKADHVSDRFGEKLSEGFVGEVITALLRRFEISAKFAMLAPHRISGGMRYSLYLQSLRLPQTNELSAALDQALLANPHYAYCRRLKQLLPAAIFIVCGDVFEAYTARLVASGQRLGNIKSMALSSLDGWETVFAETVPV